VKVEQFYGSINDKEVEEYTKYWKSVTPQSDDDIFRRWLFAYTSIHTTWESNVRCYNAIKNFHEWIDDRSLLLDKLIESKAGLHNNRTESIWNFSRDFFANPKDYIKNENETWVSFRNKLAKKCKGIGMAKVSFVLEMCFPDKAEVLCIDTHMLRLYDLKLQKFNEGKGQIVYQQAEQDWVERAKTLGASPYIARCIFWDRVQKEPDSRYWSYVLEG
jgi:thermostable 8-oxoguanine DNA glycosylase